VNDGAGEGRHCLALGAETSHWPLGFLLQTAELQRRQRVFGLFRLVVWGGMGRHMHPGWGPRGWGGPQGTGARIASALHPFRQLRHEVTEDPSPGREGERFSSTPSLGLFRATIGVHGDVMVPEDRLRAAMVQATLTGDALGDEIARLIGTPWDEELEAFRCAHEGSTVRVLHQVV